jgi:hypothetical protein
MISDQARIEKILVAIVIIGINIQNLMIQPECPQA